MQEIERRFLVSDVSIEGARNIRIFQGYLHPNKPQVRVRIATEYNSVATLTVKFKTSDPRIREEFEHEIALNEAQELYQRCEYKLEKTRYLIPVEGLIWEVDFFHGPNEGLVIAEVELPSINYSIQTMPNWIGSEVTDVKKYKNTYLAGYHK